MSFAPPRPFHSTLRPGPHGAPGAVGCSLSAVSANLTPIAKAEIEGIVQLAATVAVAKPRPPRCDAYPQVTTLLQSPALHGQTHPNSSAVICSNYFGKIFNVAELIFGIALMQQARARRRPPHQTGRPVAKVILLRDMCLKYPA